MTTKELPEGWTQVSLADLLNDATIKRVEQALLRIKRDRAKPARRPSTPAHEILVEALAPARDELLTKGVVVEWLAYYLENAVRTGKI